MINPFNDFELLEQCSEQLSFRKLATGLHFWWLETAKFELAIAQTGGQICWYKKANHPHPIIWLSDNAILDDSKSLRGGVPICWPWFGRHVKDKTQPSHGLVRNIAWAVNTFDYTSETFTIELSPTQCETVDFYVPEGVSLTQKITITDNLSIELTTNNQSKGNFEFSAALHSYFNIGEIADTEVIGLENSRYISEKTFWQFENAPKVYRFREQTDRIHFDQSEVVSIRSPLHNIELSQTGHNCYIVWNPWKTVSDNTPGMGGDTWKGMLCIEPAAFKPSLNLKSGASHTLTQTIKV